MIREFKLHSNIIIANFYVNVLKYEVKFSLELFDSTSVSYIYNKYGLGLSNKAVKYAYFYYCDPIKCRESMFFGVCEQYCQYELERKYGIRF